MMTSQVACADPDLCEAICQSRAGCTNIAFVKLVTELMPVLNTIMMMIIIMMMMTIRQSQAGCTNINFVKLVTELMPVMIIITMMMIIIIMTRVTTCQS